MNPGLAYRRRGGDEDKDGMDRQFSLDLLIWGPIPEIMFVIPDRRPSLLQRLNKRAAPGIIFVGMADKKSQQLQAFGYLRSWQTSQ
jgi:hypothetical protein